MAHGSPPLPKARPGSLAHHFGPDAGGFRCFSLVTHKETRVFQTGKGPPQLCPSWLLFFIDVNLPTVVHIIRSLPQHPSVSATLTHDHPNGELKTRRPKYLSHPEPEEVPIQDLINLISGKTWTQHFGFF